MPRSIRTLAVALLSGCAVLAIAAPIGSLGPADFSKIVAGKTTANEVRTILGAPVRAYPPRMGQGETWQYTYRGDFERRMFWVEMSPDGTVRGTSDTPDLDAGAFRRP